ncbi:hypothetical protein BGZ89_004397 [Linnemannia elongata]|nr:hypothetical protein BGZ89_004397 [Linnemannia elongata]
MPPHYHDDPAAASATTPTDSDNDNDSSFYPVATAMKELEIIATSIATRKGIDSNDDRRQGSAAAAMLQSTRSALMHSAAKTETFEDMDDNECDNSSTSTGFDDHDHDDEVQDDEEDEEEEEEEQQGRREVDRRFHLRQHRTYHLRLQQRYSDDEEEEEDKDRRDEVEEAAAGSRQTTNTLDHALHHRVLEHSHCDSLAEEGGVQATTTTTPAATIVTSSSASNNCSDANDMSSSLSHSASSSASGSPNPDVENVHGGDDIHLGRDDLSTPSPPRSQSQQQQHNRHSNDMDTSCTQQTATTATTTPPELNPKSPSRLSIPRSIHFRANTPTDRSTSGASSPLGRLQVHTVNRLEVENSFLLNQNNSLTRDIHHCRQTVQALKQILAQREDTIGRMRQEVHQAHLKIKFMDSILSGRSSLPGKQPQYPQQQRSYQMQPQQQQQHGPRYQPQPQQEQAKGLEGDWKERHRQDDDYEDDVEARGKDEEERGVEGLERSSSLLDLYAAQDEPPFNWLLKGWDEREMAATEGSDLDSAGEDEEEDDDDEDRKIPRQVRSIFSGVNDDEQYNSDDYTDEDDEEYDDDEDEDEGGLEREQVDRPRSGDYQDSGIYHHHHHNQQRPLAGSDNSSGESSCALSLSMSLGNNSTCILTQEGNDDHDDDEDACDTNAMNVINGDGCVFISGDRPPSPVALPSPAMSESSMSLESQSEGSNGSVTSLSCSSLTSTSTGNIGADEKDGPQQQQRQQESIDITSSNTSLSSVCGIDQQGLQFPTVVPYSSFRDSGHFPTQVFIMEYEEQHVVVVDDTDMQELEFQTAIRPFSPTTTASLLVHNDDSAPVISSPSFASSPTSPPASKKELSIEIDNGLSSAATALIQAKDTSHHAPLCQPNGNHPCLGVSPPMAAPLALISRVHIETNASSTTLVSVSGPTTTATMPGGSSTGHGKPTEELLSTKEVVVPAGIETSSQVDKESVADGVVTNDYDDSGNNSSTPSTPTTPTTTSWGPSSLFKGWLPSKRKNKSRSFKSKEKTTYETDGRLSPEASEVLITSKEEGNEVVVLKEKEHSVAWTMLKNQSCPAIVPLHAAAVVEREVLTSAPIVSEPAAAVASSSTLFSRLFGGGRGNRTKT